MTQYRTLYDFLAEPNSDELTLSEGEIVIAVRANGAEVDEGWLLVQRDDGPKGFVPIGYLEPLDVAVTNNGHGNMPVIDAKTESSEQDDKGVGSNNRNDEDDDEDGTDILPSSGGNLERGDTMNDEKKMAPVEMLTPIETGQTQNIPLDREIDKGDEENTISSLAKVGTKDDADIFPNRDEIVEEEDNHGKSHSRTGRLMERSEIDVRPYTDADISLYDLASNNDSFLIEDGSSSNIQNIIHVNSASKKETSGIATKDDSWDRRVVPLDTSIRRIATPGAKSEYQSRLRRRSKGACLVKPLFVSAIESGDTASLSKLTDEYFENIAEGKLQESLLEELDVLSGMAERNVKSISSLLRRMSDLNDYIDSQRTKVDVFTRVKHREDIENKAKLLVTPKKHDLQQLKR